MATCLRGAALILTALLADPLALFHPTVVLDEGERRALDHGEAIARAVSAPSRHIGVFAAVRVSVDGARVARWLDDIAAFKRSDAVSELGRFSSPPRLEDLAALTLAPEDLKTLRECTPGKCSMLFSPEEIERLREPFGRSRPWQDEDLIRVLRDILLTRAHTYLAAGRTGDPVPVFLEQQWPELAYAVESYPAQRVPGATSFLYWEKVRLGGKPTVTITHVTVVREAAPAGFEVLAISRHVFSTRYISDGWSVLALLPPGAAQPYFAYLYQARVDRLGGLFGRLLRRVVEREIKARAGDTLLGLRNRLESGDPPVTDTDVSR